MPMVYDFYIAIGTKVSDLAQIAQARTRHTSLIFSSMISKAPSTSMWCILQPELLCIKLHALSSGRVEGSCVSDPCWYAVTNATGKEVVIFDLYPNSGVPSLFARTRPPIWTDTCTATNILVKDLQAKTLSGAPVAAMCNPSTVLSPFLLFLVAEGLI
jgi:hypothetical protein